MGSELVILHLEDQEADSQAASGLLQHGGLPCRIRRITRLSALTQALESHQFDLILSAASVPGIDPVQTLQLVRERKPDLPFIFLTGPLGEERAVELLQLGATDCVFKNNLSRLVPAVRRALQFVQEQPRLQHEPSLRGNAKGDLGSHHGLLQKAMSAPTVGVLFFSLDGRMLDLNETFAKMTGYTRQELLGSVHWRMLTAPDFLDATATTAENLATRGDAPPYEKQMIRKDGSHWWGLFAPMRLSGSGSRSECMEFVIDITDRKSAEEQLRYTQQQSLLAVETAGLGTYERDLATNQISMNPACREILGIGQEPPPPDVARKSLHPEDAERILKIVEPSFDPARREVCSGEFRILRPDGSTRWVSGRGRVIFDDSVQPARPLKFTGVLFDITDRKHYEESLREEAHLARLRADFIQALQYPSPVQVLLQQAAVLLVERLDGAFARVWTLDASGQTLQLQASAGLYTHLDGAHSRLPVGHLKIGLIARDRRALFTNRILGDPNIPEQDWARREGLVAFAGFPLLLENHLLGVLALFARHPLSRAAIDTLDTLAATLAQTLGRLQAEKALRDAQQDLARTNQQLEQKVRERTAKLEETVAELEHFSYTITHDMRAPLRAMRGFAELLLSQPVRLSHDHRRDLTRRIADAALRMDHLITDALQYSHFVRARMALKPVDPLPLLRGIIESYPQFQPPQAQITIETLLPRVLANEAALIQVFSNLVGNAVKFVAPGRTPQIRIGAHPSPSHSQKPLTRIYVQDNGIGIPPQYRDKIWQMFQRLSTHYEGTGIGLALVRKVVQRMGGRVGVDSTPGEGSRFWFELALAS